MNAQTESSFFTRLPPEIRGQIQEEYLTSHLQSAIREHNKNHIFAYAFHLPRSKSHSATSNLSSSLLSPLSISCKRMYREMHRKGEATNFAILFPKRSPTTASNTAKGGGPTHKKSCTELLARRAGIAFEKEGFRWDTVRRLRFVSDRDQSTSMESLRFVIGILQSSPNLTELEFEWQTEITTPGGGQFCARIMHQIATSSFTRTIRLRGFVPETWLESLFAVPGKTVVVESL